MTGQIHASAALIQGKSSNTHQKYIWMDSITGDQVLEEKNLLLRIELPFVSGQPTA
jgi:hypothetical protein